VRPYPRVIIALSVDIGVYMDITKVKYTDIDRPLNVVPAVTPPTVVGTGVKFV
jgi:hypothetical protein